MNELLGGGRKLVMEPNVNGIFFIGEFLVFLQNVGEIYIFIPQSS
jgi:hypothetical protein